MSESKKHSDEPQTEARAIPVLLTSASEDLMAYFHATGYDKVPDDIERRLERIEAEARQPALDALREKDIVLAEARADVRELREALPLNRLTRLELLDLYDKTANRPDVRAVISACLRREKERNEQP